MRRVWTYLLIALLLPCLFAPAIAGAQMRNPMFGDKQNQFGVYGAGSTGTGSPLSHMGSKVQYTEDLGEIELQYSQPSEFFRLPARSSVHLIQIIGEDKTQPAFGLMQEFLFIPNLERFYAGLGLGIYMKERANDGRIDSRFTFGERLFLGYHFDSMTLELYWRHFSNGDLTPINTAYNFFGLGTVWNF